MDNDFMMPIGKRIAEVRHSRNLTQEALANELNLSPKHISHVERGASSLSLQNFVKLSRILDCSLDYLILGESNNALSKLPPEIMHLLFTGSKEDIGQLNRYLQTYVELMQKNK